MSTVKPATPSYEAQELARRFLANKNASFDVIKDLAALIDRHARKLAEKACWALMQDDAVSVAMLEDGLEPVVEKALHVAEKTNSVEDAIYLAEEENQR